MTQVLEKRKSRRGRIFPEIIIPESELASRRSKMTEIGLRCRAIFERIRPELINNYYNWFIAVAIDRDDYIIAPNLLELMQKIKSHYADRNDQIANLTIFRLNAEGYCGSI